jgi:hypothetical protein
MIDGHCHINANFAALSLSYDLVDLELLDSLWNVSSCRYARALYGVQHQVCTEIYLLTDNQACPNFQPGPLNSFQARSQKIYKSHDPAKTVFIGSSSVILNSIIVFLI